MLPEAFRSGWRTTLCLIAALASLQLAQAAPRPNIVLMMADDLGYGDLACYGHPEIRTPHLDQLARDGLRLTSYFSPAANCSPARTGMMTGRTPYRAGVFSAIPFMSPVHLRPHETTLATWLQQAGYDTALVGKWHLNGLFNLPGQPQPDDHGFRHWFATQNNALPNHRNPYNFVRNGIPMGPQEGYASHIVARETAHWLREGREADKPFFLFINFHEPHEPIATAAEYSRHYDYPDDPSKVAYYGNVTQMDAAVGKILATLDELGLRDNTLVLFTSDNGPARTRYHVAGSSGPLREFKGHLYEGGIRVPCIARWPGHIQAGSESDIPVCGTDWLPTFCSLVKIDPPDDRLIDGANVLPVLLENRPIQRERPLYWQFNWARSGPKVALRSGDYKIVGYLDTADPDPGDLSEATREMLKTARLTHYELYNLVEDIGETTDLRATHPEKLAEMRALAEIYFAKVQHETPVWPDWKFPRYESQRIKWPDYVAPK